MVQQKERIVQFLIWPKACRKARKCLKNFGLKLQIVQSICPIVAPQEVYKKKPHNKLGVERSLQFPIFVCLGALHMHMYQIKRDPSQMIKGRSMCSLAMIQALRAISSIIRALEKSLLVKMWNSMKKAHEIGAPKKKRNMISFLYLKRKIRGMKFTKSLSPPPSPAASSPIHECPSSSSLLEGSSSERPRKMRSLQDLYDSKQITDGVNTFLSIC